MKTRYGKDLPKPINKKIVIEDILIQFEDYNNAVLPSPIIYEKKFSQIVCVRPTPLS